MKLAIAADHGAFELKESIKKHLEEKGIEYEDFGCYSKESVDYPRFAYRAAKSVADKKCDFGVICCTTGLGVSMAANKVKGIRAALCTNELMAKMTRLHNDANILCLGARVVDTAKAVKLVDLFLDTPFSGEERHSRRIAQITEIENKQ